MKHLSLRLIKYCATRAQQGLSEMRYVKSVRDLKILYSEFVYLLNRTNGSNRIIEGIPPSIQIEPTNYCNIRCICCPTSKSTRKRGFMDFDLFKKIIDNAQQEKMKIVHLYLHGEPMLHPRIVEMIGYVKDRGLAVHLATNGMLFTREMLIGILNSGVDISDHFTFSILGGSKETHEVVMRKVAHERVLENIDYFLALRKEMKVNGPIIETIFYTMPENQHEIPLYLKTFKSYVDHARIVSKISISFSEYKTKREDLIKHRKQSCSHLWERLTVFWNGDVTICHQNLDGDWIFGNLANQSIQEICENEKFINVKTIHMNGQFEKIPICNECDI